jgi:hypothetical protein
MQISNIQEISTTDRSSFIPTWWFQTSWNGKSTFQYPDHRAQLERFRWLLEEHAHADPLHYSKASQIRNELDHYRNVLFQSLAITQISKAGYIDVYDYDDNSTLHSIPWELLEGCHGSIVVRRHVKVVPPPFVTAPPTSRTFNILIVAARASKDEEEYRQAALPILRVLQSLPDGAPLVTVDIVRPGRFASLEEHLKDTKTRRTGFSYHLVHLDLHGKVNKKGL